MTVCVVNGCHNASHKNKKDSNITFHTFPVDPVASARWTEKIRLNRNESWWKPSKLAKICSEHFNDKDKYMTKGGLCRIRNSAVPTKDIPVFCIPLDDQTSLDCNKPNEQQPEPTTSADERADSEGLEVSLSPADVYDLSPIFDTPKEASLRNQLYKKVSRIKILTRKIKCLKQKNRRLIKRNLLLKKIIGNNKLNTYNIK